MTKSYITKGTCSRKIDLELNDGIITNVKFHGGCDGNLKGTKCGFKPTSCPDQLALALEEALSEENGN